MAIESPDNTFTSVGSAELDRRFDALLGLHDWSKRPGVAYAVIEGDRVVHERCHGLANLTFGIPITPTTRFPIASITKPFAAAVAMMLVAQGRLDVDAPVRGYIPELHPFEPVVTVRHLLTMTSGIREEYGLVEMATGAETTPRSVEATLGLVLAQTTQSFAAGSVMMYCNSNYTLLQRILEQIEHKDFGTILREHVFEPLALSDTDFLPGFRPEHDDAIGYVRHGETGWEIHDLVIERSAAGGIVSTLDDLKRWHANVRHNRLEPGDLFKRLLTPVVLTDGSESTYAYGIQRQTYAGRRTVGHAGGLGPYCSEHVYFPDDDVAVVLLANQIETNWYERARELALAWIDPVENAPTRPRTGATIWSADYGSLELGRAFRVERLMGGLRLDNRVFHETPHCQFVKPNAVAPERLLPMWPPSNGTGGEQIPETIRYEEGSRCTELRRAEWAPARAELVEYAGTYASHDLPGSHIIWVEDDSLMLCVGGGFPPGRILELIPIHRDLFRAKDSKSGDAVDYSLAFRREREALAGLDVSLSRIVRFPLTRVSTDATLPTYVALATSRMRVEDSQRTTLRP